MSIPHDVTDHMLIGVDEAHADSREAMIAGFSFMKTRDHGVVFSVIPKNTTSRDISKSLESAYAGYVLDYGFNVRVVTADLEDNTTVAQTFLKEARIEKSKMLVVGAGNKTTSGALGSVAQELVNNAYRHILIVKRQHNRFEVDKPRVFLFAADGSDLNKKALETFAGNMLKAHDALRVVTLSHHDGEKDKAILDEAKHLVTSANKTFPPEHLTCQFIPRVADVSIGSQLCDLVADMDGHCLVLAPSRESVKVLGSTTVYAVSHSAVSVLVMKAVVTTEDN